MKIVAVSLTLFFSLFAGSLHAQERHPFLTVDEADAMQSTMMSGVRIIVLEDFEEYSSEPAVITYVSEHALRVRRDNIEAVLVDRITFLHLMDSTPELAADSCSAECNASAAAGAIGGALSGAGTGGQLGGAAGPGGVVGGAVVGGLIGGLGGGIAGWEACRIATRCEARTITTKSKGGE